MKKIKRVKVECAFIDQFHTLLYTANFKMGNNYIESIGVERPAYLLKTV